MQVIIATKNGKKRSFTERTWDLLGASKEGWVQLPDVEIKNIATKQTAPASRPATGTNKRGDQKVTNVATPPAPEQTVSNTEAPASGEQAEAPQGDAAEVSEEQKAEFLKVAEGLNAGIIKDFFDGHNPQIVYNKKSNQVQLTKQLGAVLGWSVVEFQKLFS